MIAVSPFRNRRGQARLRATRGQALVELAIFGSVLLAALAFLIRIGMNWNFEQEVRMAAFRRALAAAHADNAQPGDVQTGIQDAVATTFHVIADRQMPNPSDGFMSLPRVRTEASAFVEWGNRLTFAHIVDEDGDGIADSEVGRRTQQLIVVRANNEEVLTDEGEFPRQDDFPRDRECERGDGTIVLIANRGIVLESWLDNETGESLTGTPATITQTQDSSELSSRTRATSKTRLNMISLAGLPTCEAIDEALSSEGPIIESVLEPEPTSW